MSLGKLYLFPNVLDEQTDHSLFLPKAVDIAVSTIDGLIAESEKSARVFLKRFNYDRNRTFRDIPIRLLNEHSTEKETQELLEPIEKGETWGLISDCGLVCFADPGAGLVNFANKKKIKVEAFPGPSSLIMALLLSGLTAQSFSFHGYLPQDRSELAVKLKQLEESSSKNKSTQIFIEAPYRNEKILEILLSTLKNNTQLCIAADLTSSTQFIETLPVINWKAKKEFAIGKRPAIFLFQC